MKINNVAPTGIEKTKTNINLKNAKNFISENKKLVRATAGMAGLVGLAIYAVATIKPTNATPDIYNEYAQKIEQQCEVIPKENKNENEINELKLKLSTARKTLSNDVEQQAQLGKLLTIPELNNKEYIQQQYDILDGFIVQDRQEVNNLVQKLQEIQNKKQVD